MSRLAFSLLLSVKLLKHLYQQQRYHLIIGCAYINAFITILGDKSLVFTTISNATFREVIRRHFDLNFITG